MWNLNLKTWKLVSLGTLALNASSIPVLHLSQEFTMLTLAWAIICHCFVSGVPYIIPILSHKAVCIPFSPDSLSFQASLHSYQ